MYRTGLVKIVPTASTLHEALKKTVTLTREKLYVFADEQLKPDILSSIYCNHSHPGLYVLCGGIELSKFTELDDVDVFMSSNPNDVKFLRQLQSQSLYWKKTKFIHIDVDEGWQLSQDKSQKIFPYGVLGGTFDDLHPGHKLLLTTASSVCSEKLLVGITHQDLLRNKKFGEFLQPYDVRDSMVRSFIRTVNPTISLRTVAISDPIGPAGTDPDLNVIVVSKETEAAVDVINEKRIHGNLKTLESQVVDLIVPSNSSDKISSTDVRKSFFGQLLNREAKPWNRFKDKSFGKVQPYVIGLTGGICSGKSTASNYLNQKNIPTIDCDKLGHQTYQPDGKAYKSIIAEFGDGVIGEDKLINRKALGSIVFSSPEKLRKLNEIVWPCIADLVVEQISNTDSDIIIIEAAVMLEANWDTLVDEVWTMIVSPDTAVSRLSERNGLAREEAVKRLSSQMTNYERVSRSDLVICSDWDSKITRSYLDASWEGVLRRLKYHKICRHSTSIADRWLWLATEISDAPVSDKWLENLCRSEKSKSFLDITLGDIDNILNEIENDYLVFYTAAFFLATTLHIQNTSTRSHEAMFQMFKESNNIKKHIADEVMVNVKVFNTLQKKTVPTTHANSLFYDVFMRGLIFSMDEGDKRILPSIFTVEDSVKEQYMIQSELILRLLEGNRFIFKTSHFRNKFEDLAKLKLTNDFEKLNLESAESIKKVREKIGYSLQEY